MNDPITYEKWNVTDYGSLQELTAGCLGATGGDAAVRSGHIGEFNIGPEIHNSQIQCTSSP
jgi:hypothetical protein